MVSSILFKHNSLRFRVYFAFCVSESTTKCINIVRIISSISSLTMYDGRIYISTKKVLAVADWRLLSTTRKEVRSFMHLCNFNAKFFYNVNDLTVQLTDLLRSSPSKKATHTHTGSEAFEILKLRLISAPCWILSEVSSGATFTVTTNGIRLWNCRNHVTIARRRTSANLLLGV
jgi:hypothetical protein